MAHIPEKMAEHSGEVRTMIINSDKDTFIPELNFLS